MQLFEELQLKLLPYLNANDLITFCYGSKCFRKLVLKKFSKIFEISIGFCSVWDWTYVIQKNVFNLIQDIHNDSFFNETFHTYNFDYEDLDERCRRSCERKANYCKICLRVRDNDYFHVDKFSNVHLTSFLSFLDILSDEHVDFDVFLCKHSSSCCSFCHSNSSDKKCANFEVFNYARHLFAAFCDVLVRMYLNYTVE